MTVSVRSAARRICEKSGWTVSNLELQKLLYVAQMFHLGQYGVPLINGRFEAWDYGPVIPSLYHQVKMFGRDAIKPFALPAPELDDEPEAETLDDVVDQLGNAKPGQLVAITHWDRGAWAKHYVPGRMGIVIPQQDILQEYRDRVDVARERAARDQ